jgi:glycine cleavage system H protein
MSQKNYILYTPDHEWIAYLSNGTYMGISGFKLTGIRKIDDVRLFSATPNNTVVKGTPLLHLFYKDYLIAVQAPVDCKVLAVNKVITLGLWERIIQDPEGLGWLFKIEPVSDDRGHLITKDAYQTRFQSPATKETIY